MSVLLAALLLAGCAKESTDAYWLQGAAFSWEHFNHRVTHLEWAVDDQAPVAAIIGGTSTTGVSASLPDTCDPDTCGELPFTDSSDVALSWVSATSQRVVFARGSIDLVADAGLLQPGQQAPLGLLRRRAVDVAHERGLPVALRLGRRRRALLEMLAVFVDEVVRGVEQLQFGDMAVGRDHEVAGVVGVKVHDYEGETAAMENQVFRIVILWNHAAEEAGIFLLPQDVFDSPGRPDGPAHKASLLCLSIGI